jgi:hypothetical protein
VGGLFGDFGHPDRVAVTYKAIEGGSVFVELITKNQDEMTKRAGNRQRGLHAL